MSNTHTAGVDSLLSRIAIDPPVCHGKPTMRGLRYSVVSMLKYLAAGDSIDDLLALFRDLERDDLSVAEQRVAISKDTDFYEYSGAALRRRSTDGLRRCGTSS